MKLYAYLAAALALAAFGLYVNRLQHKAARVDVAEAALSTERKQRAADIKWIEKSLAASEAGRLKLISDITGIEQRFADIKIPAPKVLIQTREVPGACPVSTVGPEFVSVFNSASSP